MSIVGTRPPLISETNLYEPRHKARLAIKPGITGMWQVSGRSDITDFEEVVRLDKEYIENWDIGLDIKILLKTVMVVAKKDGSEKLFRGDKSYLGNKSIRVYSEESERAKIFVEFVAMILRCKMYIKLKEEMKKLEKKPNYMAVLEALKELEKIEMVRQLDNVYRLDHAVTANQKTILNAFGLDANHIKYYASELSKELKKAE